jgi:hypothetical protein
MFSISISHKINSLAARMFRSMVGWSIKKGRNRNTAGDESAVALTGPRGGEGMTFTDLSNEDLSDRVNLLLQVFFTSTAASQAAGHTYLDG